MAWFYLAIIFLHATQVSTALDCQGTLIEGPTVFADDESCGDVISAWIDTYEPILVNECNRQMEYSEDIHHIDAAEVTHCASFGNGTIRYGYDACCPGELTELQCFTCVNETVQQDALTDEFNTHYCNMQGMNTCAADEKCMTQYNYHPDGSGGTTYEVTKGCSAVCDSMDNNDVNTCQNDVMNPSCTSCCVEPLCNAFASFTELRAFDPNFEVCDSSPCINGGICNATGLPDPLYTCTCAEGYLGDDCQHDYCYYNPCNGHPCRTSSSDPYYVCHCNIGWFGQHCTEEYSLCSENVCLNGGVCYEQEYYSRCLCPEGYVGATCEIQASTNASCPVGHLHLRLDSLKQQIKTADHPVTCTSKANYIANKLLTVSWPVSDCKNKLFPDFKDGVDGDLSAMRVTYAGVYFCEQGDTMMEYKLDFCCPACLAQPCQNGGWCIQNDDGYVCKCRFGYSGNQCQYETAMCVIYGDPHHSTFDDQYISFQNDCKYNAVSFPGNETIGIPAFSVYTKYERRGTNTEVSYMQYIEVDVYGHVIRLGKDNVVTIDGVVQPSDFDVITLAGGNLTVKKSGTYILLETDFGLSVDYDGNWVSTISIPKELAGMVTGLCGNNNGDPSDDLTTSTGEDVSDDPSSYSLVGNSWWVEDPEVSECSLAVTQNLLGCENITLPYIDTQEFCGLITNQALDSPFSSCLTQNPEYAQMFGDSCHFDVCNNKDDPDAAKEAACGSLKALAEACAHQGLQFNWRGPSDCGLNCTGGTVYAYLGSACPSTCTNPQAAELCSLQETETCECPGDQVLLGDQCVDPVDCGCRDENGQHFETGTVWKTDGCTLEHVCEFCADCEGGYGQISTVSTACPVYAPVCDEEQCDVPCKKLFCLGCHNTNDYACMITGRYNLCPSEHTCYYSSETLSTGRNVVYRGCLPFEMCPETNTANDYCDLGVANPTAPEKPLHLCQRPDYGICSCKGDPHCILFDGLRVEDLRSGCVLDFARDGCVNGAVASTPTFEVLINPKFSEDDTRVVVAEATLLYNGANVTMGLDFGIVYLDGQELTLSTGSEVHDNSEGIHLEIFDGKMMRVTLSNGVVAEWDFDKQFAVMVPESMKGTTCGICGNYGGDGPVFDFMTGPADKDDICPNLPNILDEAGLTPGQPGTDLATQTEAWAMSWLRQVDPTEEHCQNMCG